MCLIKRDRVRDITGAIKEQSSLSAESPAATSRWHTSTTWTARVPVNHRMTTVSWPLRYLRLFMRGFPLFDCQNHKGLWRLQDGFPLTYTGSEIKCFISYDSSTWAHVGYPLHCTVRFPACISCWSCQDLLKRLILFVLQQVTLL